MLFAAIVLLEFASATIVSVESGDPAANIKTAGDALWWSYVTVTTIGYGDYYPVTTTGRLIGVLVMTVGVGVFSILTGYLAKSFLGRPTDPVDIVSEATVETTAQAEITAIMSQLVTIQTSLAEQEKSAADLQRRLMVLHAQLLVDTGPPATTQ